MDDTDRQIERALGLHRAGNAQAAEQIYRAVLAGQPDHADALYLTGCLAHQRGANGSAVSLLEKAIAASPSRPEFHYALANALAPLDQLDRAEASLRQALALGSRAEFHAALGQLLVRLGRLPEAVAELEAAAAAGDQDAYLQLGKTLLASANPQAATAALEAALKLRPDDLPTLAALRKALAAAGREREAQARLDHAAAPLAQNAARLCSLADALQSAQDFSGAVTLYQRALALPESAPLVYRAHYACGCAQLAEGDFAAAIPSFTQALALQPEAIEPRHNLARALYEMGHVTAACREFAACAARNEKGASLARAMLAVVAPGDPALDHAAVLAARQAWVRDLRPGTLPAAAPLGVQARKNHAGDKLRIGYVSSFFQRDNWMKPVWGLINEHDRDAFDVHLFSDAPLSAIQHGYRAHPADQFHDITRLSNKAAAQLIRDTQIHILIDLNGFSEPARLPLYLLRPAPVQLGWFNMYATTGMSCFRALIGDGSVLLPPEESFYSEKILRVPGSYLAFSVDYPVPPVAPMPCLAGSSAPEVALGDAPGRITFGCLGSQYKLTPEVIAAWSRILAGAPASRLLLKNKALSHPAAQEFLRAQFAHTGLGKPGIAPERLLLEGPEPHFDFLRAYDRIDLALDTFPYNGGTTTTEALWQGVPVLTFTGDRWASRTSASLLRAAGLDRPQPALQAGFVAPTLEAHIAQAVHIATTPAEWPALAQLRATMRERLAASPVCDTNSLARAMEQIYRDCWQSSQA